MVSGIQIIGIIFGLILSYFTFLHYKRNEFTIREFLSWQSLWVAFILVTLYPSKFLSYSTNLGATRAFDLFSLLGFTVVLTISFYTYVSLDRLRRQLEKAIRDAALQDSKDNTKENE